VSDIAQNFAPTPAFPQLSSTPATITALHFNPYPANVENRVSS
jgi:hypothetical protein